MIAGLLYLKRDSLSFLYNNLIWGIFVIVSIEDFPSKTNFLLLKWAAEKTLRHNMLLARYFNFCLGTNVEQYSWFNICSSRPKNRTHCKCRSLFYLGCCVLFHIRTNLESDKWTSIYESTKRCYGKVITCVYAVTISGNVLFSGILCQWFTNAICCRNIRSL